MLHITQFSIDADRKLALYFNDGRYGTVSLQCLLAADLPRPFQRLQDHDFFHAAELRSGTVGWPGELDLAPEYFYFLCFRNDPSLREQFSMWGYLNPVAAHA